MNSLNPPKSRPPFRFQTMELNDEIPFVVRSYVEGIKNFEIVERWPRNCD